ncbi:MAG: bifunctional phosphoribosylaminoimidazolecarboxamide formyltransferase/IMP cyclohydrolase [Candidatus Omnitrophota bacterium]
MLTIKRVLISVSDKTNLEPLVKKLSSLEVEIISTGGSARFISSLGINVKQVDEITGFNEMLDGRVKTLHPKIHAGLLALRHHSRHMAQLQAHDIGLIDMVVVNLYPFKRTILKPDIKLEEAIENIDIGGPSMLRSAAKNYRSVAVLTNPSQYDRIIKELDERGGCITDNTLAGLAVDAFSVTAEYDSCIKAYLKKRLVPNTPKAEGSIFPDELVLSLDKAQDLRYGENEHQKAAFYKRPFSKELSVSNARQLHGKALSYNNIMDLDAAYEAVKDFDEPAACIIKHATACGMAAADTLTGAFSDALSTDTLSAFGGIIGLNRKVDMSTAEAVLAAGFVECVIAPGYEQNALARLMSKQNMRVLSVDAMSKTKDRDEFHFRNITGGLLVQQRDAQDIDQSQLKIVTQRKPTPDEVRALIFAWKAVKFIRSNAIVLVRGTKTVGIGAGQMSRVDSVFMAIHKSGERSAGSVLASDAFFPKEDAVEMAASAGITSIIQPGGSKADELIIDVCNRCNIAMVLTGIRHFRH